MTLTSCHPDPARALVPVLARMPGSGIRLGDVLADSGYAHRTAAHCDLLRHQRPRQQRTRGPRCHSGPTRPQTQ